MSKTFAVILTFNLINLIIFFHERFTRVNGGSFGSPAAKTSVHAVLDYDDDGEGTDDDTEDYYDENIPHDARVTPIQGPIYLKNGSVPVVPLYSYPQLQNGSFVQIPVIHNAFFLFKYSKEYLYLYKY